MSTDRHRRVAPLAAFALALAVSTAAFAADEAQVLRQRAEQLAAEDRCAEALPRVARARALAPDDARAASLEGRCLLRLGRYADAIPALRRAREIDPSLPGVAADLAQAHYHRDELAEADAELTRAEAEAPDDARVHLYRGLLLARDARDAEAAEAFDRAGQLDSALAGPSSLYAGRSWASVREREAAAQAFERARRTAPGSEWAQAAERALENLDAGRDRQIWGRARVGIEYDDNVALRVDRSNLQVNSLGQTPPVKKKHDWRVVFDGDVGAEFVRDADQAGGVSVGYRGNAHVQRFHAFDLQNPWISFWYDRRVGDDTWLRIQPFAGYAWLEGDPFVVHGGALASLTHPFTRRLDAVATLRVNYNDYLFRIRPDPQLQALNPIVAADARRRRNRDGTHVEAGAEARYDVPVARTLVRLGTGYDRYEASGKDWDRHGWRAWAGLGQPLPLPVPVRLEVEGSFAYHDHDHRSSHEEASKYLAGRGPQRFDRIWEVETELAWDVTHWLTLSARWNYLDNFSNIGVFEFDRHIVGGYLTVFFQD